MSEADIIERLKREDSTAFRKIIERCYPAIAGFVKQGSGSAADADDVMQETLIVLIKSLREGKFRGDSKLSTYVIGIGRNLWMNHRKKRNPGLVIDEMHERFIYTIDKEDLEEKTMKEERYRIIEKGFHEISEVCREVLEKYYYKQESLGVIAEEMDYSYQFAKVKKHRCLQALRDAVKTISQNLPS